MHRVLPLPGRLPRPARPPACTTSSSARASWSTPRRSRCTRSTPRTALAELRQAARHRLLQHHQVLHEGLPRGHHHHRQRHHSAEGARGRRVLRSAEVVLLRAVGFRTRTEDGRMFELKPLSREAIPAALAKAERYRLLNEPGEAESICLDILGVEPDNQEALVDAAAGADRPVPRPGVSARTTRARALLPRLTDEYDRLYYAGIISERRARAHLARGGPGVGSWPTAGSRRRWGSSSARRHPARRQRRRRAALECVRPYAGASPGGAAPDRADVGGRRFGVVILR